MKGHTGEAGTSTPANETGDRLDAYANEHRVDPTNMVDVFDGLDVATFGAIVAEEPPPPDPIVNSLFEAGDKVEVVGESKSRKSWWVLSLVLHIAAGVDFSGLRIEKPRKVVYANLELTPKWLARRLRALMKAYGITPDMIGDRLVIVNARGCADDLRSRLESFPDESGVDLVVLDPRYKLNDRGQDDNSAADLASLLEVFDSVASRGPAVLTVVHDGKGIAGDRDIRDRGAGSSVAGRDCDARITLTRHTADPEYKLVVEVLQRNFDRLAPFTVEFDRRSCSFRRCEDVPVAVTTATSKSARSTDAKIEKAVVETVERKGCPSTKEIVASVGAATGFHERRIRESLGRLVACGRIRSATETDSLFSPKRYTVCTETSTPSQQKEGGNG